MKQIQKIYSNKISADNAQEEWGNVTSLAYRTLVRPRLVGFLSQSWYCLNPRKGAKFIQMKFHGTCLDEETDFNRSQVTDILRNILVMRLTTDPRILLFNL